MIKTTNYNPNTMPDCQIAAEILAAKNWDEVSELVEYLEDTDRVEIPKEEDGTWSIGWDDIVETWCNAQGAVLDDNGEAVNFQAAVDLMDDDLREELHKEMAPCSMQEFFDAYAKAHFERFGEEFPPAVGGIW